jgi:hypothetical protein
MVNSGRRHPVVEGWFAGTIERRDREGGASVVDKFRDPLLSRKDTARHLAISRSSPNRWSGEEAAGPPLVHGVRPEHVGWPSVPFVAVVEAYVLRSLRDLGPSMNEIREAAAEVRTTFDTPFGLATHKIATDGIDIFLDFADGLTSCGWVIHRITAQFADDAQHAPDEEWLAYGLCRG